MDRGVPTDFSPQFASSKPDFCFDWGKAFSQTFPSRVEPSDSHSGTWKLGNKFTRDVFARLVHKVPPKIFCPKKKLDDEKLQKVNWCR